jgi:hypothetical protein
MSENTKSKAGPASRAAKEERAAPAKGEQTVECRRLHLPLAVSEHASCPYCYGKESDIRTGDHARFCDFEEGKDPVCFGFPWT